FPVARWHFGGDALSSQRKRPPNHELSKSGMIATPKKRGSDYLLRIEAGSEAWSIRIPVDQPMPERHPQDVQVEPGRPVRDVVEVVLDALAEGGVAAPAVDLGPASDAGLDAVAGHVVGDRLAE